MKYEILLASLVAVSLNTSALAGVSTCDDRTQASIAASQFLHGGESDLEMQGLVRESEKNFIFAAVDEPGNDYRYLTVSKSNCDVNLGTRLLLRCSMESLSKACVVKYLDGSSDPGVCISEDDSPNCVIPARKNR